MIQYPMHIDDEDALSASGEVSSGGTRTGEVWKNAAGDVRVMIWKAEPGQYSSPGRPYAETFIMMDGEADVTVGEALPRHITSGSIVHIPAGAYILLDVHRAMSKLATAAKP